MKTALLFLFLIAICGESFAQKKENYRSRNHKLNRNYSKSINTKKHQIAVYKSDEGAVHQSNLKNNHQTVQSLHSKKLVMKHKKKVSPSEHRVDRREQKSTFRGSNKKSGKTLINYVTMILAFSLMLVSN